MKITIELTEQQERYLKLFAEKQYEGANDNLCTQQPIHVAQTQRSIVTDEDYDCDKIEFVVPDWEHMSFDTLKEVVEQYYEGNGEGCPIPIVSFDEAYGTDGFVDVEGDKTSIVDQGDYLEAYGMADDIVTRTALKYYYEDVAFFFTLQSAKEYIKYQSHNLDNPRTYTKGGGYSNSGEYHHFWELLMSMGVKLNEGGR